MMELLRQQGHQKASLAVQKANYAVRMYEAVGFQMRRRQNAYRKIRGIIMPSF